MPDGGLVTNAHDLGHGGHDPGVSALVSHHRMSATTIVVCCNHDRGTGPRLSF